MNATAQTDKARSGAGRWLLVAIVVVAAGVLSGFYGVNEYASGTKVLVDIAKADSERFETVYRDTSDKRLATLRFSLDILRSNGAITTAFSKDDRPALQAKVEGFFKNTLNKRYDFDQLNFFTPPATVYLRSDDPKVYGNDLSAVRRTVVVAGERRQMVSGMETGLGGVVALRAVAPVLDGARLVGTIGVGDAITRYLNLASSTAGMDYALGLNRQVAEKAERAPDPKNDTVLDDDVFTHYSTPETGQLMRSITFKPRATDSTLLAQGGRNIFVRTFVLNNFAGVPTVVIATLRDLSAGFIDVRNAVAVKAALLFLVVSILGSIAVVKFQSIRDGLQGAMTRQRKELEKVTADLAAAKGKLEAADQLKRGFFTNMVLSLNEPLQAVVGQLQNVTPTVDAVLAGANAPDVAGRDVVAGRLRFALTETSRFSHLVADYRGLEELRGELAAAGKQAVALAPVVALALEEDLALARRLPHLKMTSTVGSDLPKVNATEEALRRAVTNLVEYAERGAGRGTVVIAAAAVDKMVKVTITGTAFEMAGVPTADLLNEAQQFLWRLSASPASFASSGALIGVLQAQAIVQAFGGKLDVVPAGSGQPGFAFTLPAAS